MKREKRNNKGFSLVELIVVIAIMAILAVTLAPRLTQYIEKARVASDKQAIDSIFNAAQLANAEFPMDVATFNLKTITSPDTPSIYTVTGKKWALNNSYDPDEDTFEKALQNILGGFELQSSDAGEDTTIVITKANGLLTVTLNYSGADASDYVRTE